MLFDGSGPDPSEENLAPLKKLVLEKKSLAGLATDGDADRFGILDRDGTFVQPNHILGLVFDYLLETRGEKLGASRSVATTHLIDAVARLHGVKAYETPVGFKYVGPLLRAGKIALGGEESAGMTIHGHLPEKDGILACLLVAEMIAARQESLGDQLQRSLPPRGRRILAGARKFASARGSPGQAARTLAAKTSANSRDTKSRRSIAPTACKLIFDDSSWILMRPSGTEPVVRIYTEAATARRR